MKNKGFNCSFVDYVLDEIVSGRVKVYTTEEMLASTRESMKDAILSAVGHYKNTSPKYIISKSTCVMSSQDEDLVGREGTARMITELIREGVLALNGDGKLYVVE